MAIRLTWLWPTGRKARSKLHLFLELTDDPESLRLGKQAVRELNKLVMVKTLQHRYGVDLDDEAAGHYLEDEDNEA